MKKGRKERQTNKKEKMREGRGKEGERKQSTLGYFSEVKEQSTQTREFIHFKQFIMAKWKERWRDKGKRRERREGKDGEK